MPVAHPVSWPSSLSFKCSQDRTHHLSLVQIALYCFPENAIPGRFLAVSAEPLEIYAFYYHLAGAETETSRV